MTYKILVEVPLSTVDKDWFKQLKRKVNTTDYQFVQDWKLRYDNNEYKYIILQRGEREDDDGPDLMCFGTSDEAVVQLIKDTMYDIGSEYELDKVPLELIEEFHKNDIDGGVIYLKSSHIKDPKELLKYKHIRTTLLENKTYKDVRMMDAIEDEIERRGGNIRITGTDFLLSFNLIRIALNNDIIKDPELKEKAAKFYSCYKRYMKAKAKKELANIDKIKSEIKELSEETRKQMIYDGQVKRNGSGLPFDEFLYWTYLLKSGDRFEIPSLNDKGENKRFEIVSIERYPKKYDICDDTNYINVDEDKEPVSYYFPQHIIGDNNYIKFIMD
jgi:hypothetical protein